MQDESTPPPPLPYPYGGSPALQQPESRAPQVDLEFHQLHRAGHWHGGFPQWRSILGIALWVLTFFFVSAVVGAIAIVGLGAATGSVADAFDELQNIGEEVTPLGLAVINLSLIGLIPAAWVLSRVIHGLRPGWLSSVVPRLRWGWMLVCFGLAFLALVATVIVSAVLPDQGGPATSGELNDFTTTVRDFLIVIVFLTPLQAAAEEYWFRGYVTQGFGSLVSDRRLSIALAVVFPALIFAAFHGAQDAPIFFDRFAFGVSAGFLVILTGGLEAPIAMHVLNNFLAFGFALAFGDMTSALNPSGGTWWSIPVTLTQSLVFLGLCVAAARAMGIQTRSTVPGANVLEPDQARV